MHCWDRSHSPGHRSLGGVLKKDRLCEENKIERKWGSQNSIVRKTHNLLWHLLASWMSLLKVTSMKARCCLSRREARNDRTVGTITFLCLSLFHSASHRGIMAQRLGQPLIHLIQQCPAQQVTQQITARLEPLPEHIHIFWCWCHFASNNKSVLQRRLRYPKTSRAFAQDWRLFALFIGFEGMGTFMLDVHKQQFENEC